MKALRLLALVAPLALGCSDDTGGRHDAGGDASDASEDGAGLIQAYRNAGCGTLAVPEWISPIDTADGAMTCSYCLCTNKTAQGPCTHAPVPFAHRGACVTDGGGQ